MVTVRLERMKVKVVRKCMLKDVLLESVSGSRMMNWYNFRNLKKRGQGLYDAGSTKII